MRRQSHLNARQTIQRYCGRSRVGEGRRCGGAAQRDTITLGNRRTGVEQRKAKSPRPEHKFFAWPSWPPMANDGLPADHDDALIT